MPVISKLREIRRRLELSQKDMGVRFDVVQTTWSEIENGRIASLNTESDARIILYQIKSTTFAK